MLSSTKNVCLLGSTGSVGENTLNVIRQHPDSYRVVALACGSSVEKLRQQILEFNPRFVSLGSEEAAAELRQDCPACIEEIFIGPEGHRQAVETAKPDIVMASMSGTYGLSATLQAIRQNVGILGIANKEVLVMAGKFINEALASSSTKLVPVDSEHSAIFQALQGNRLEDLKKILLTASGGPFRTWPKDKFKDIRLADALKHPNWVMGAKITIDSSTMMNKGLEYIEAIQLFQVRPDQIEILVHPQSIIHSMVEYCDGSILAQMGISDMKIPIAFALSYPDRLDLSLSEHLDFAKLKRLDFEKPDFERFPCLQLAMSAASMGAAGPIALNASNELAVDSFLKEKLSYAEIPRLVEAALGKFASEEPQNLEEAIQLDSVVKRWTESQVAGENKESLRRVSL